jgi:dual specificity MAP kinase phosphatase
MTIGRAPGSAIPINHTSVSRHHAVLSVDEDSVVTITDLASRNGVEVGRLGRIAAEAPVRLQTGDTVSLGRHVRLEFLAGSTVAYTPPAKEDDDGG